MDDPESGRKAGGLGEEACRLAGLGFKVFRCRVRDKPPLRPGWQREATTDPDQVRRLWRERPNANVGLATGGHVFVLDVDGPTGSATLQGLVARLGRLPPTPASRTGSGGWHFLFAMPAGSELRNSAGRIGCGLDTRGAGGFVVVPPSIHPNGRGYRWVRDREPWSVPLAPLPTWIADAMADAPELVPADFVAAGDEVPPGARRSTNLAAGELDRDARTGEPRGRRYALAALQREADAVRSAAAGTRNATLNEAAFKLGRFVASGVLSPELVGDELARAARDAGLHPKEIAATIRSAIGAAAGGAP